MDLTTLPFGPLFSRPRNCGGRAPFENILVAKMGNPPVAMPAWSPGSHRPSPPFRPDTPGWPAAPPGQEKACVRKSNSNHNVSRFPRHFPKACEIPASPTTLSRRENRKFAAMKERDALKTRGEKVGPNGAGISTRHKTPNLVGSETIRGARNRE